MTSPSRVRGNDPGDSMPQLCNYSAKVKIASEFPGTIEYIVD
jgi:hypothetical protein